MQGLELPDAETGGCAAPLRPETLGRAGSASLQGRHPWVTAGKLPDARTRLTCNVP